MKLSGRVIAVCVSQERGTTKSDCGRGVLEPDYGLVGDAHAGSPVRQVSLLAQESVARARAEGVPVVSDNHGENLTTSGIDLHRFPVGTRLAVGEEAVLEITQIGKAEHDSPIFDLVKNRILPHEGVFAKVVLGGLVKTGDRIRVEGKGSGS